MSNNLHSRISFTSHRNARFLSFLSDFEEEFCILISRVLIFAITCKT